MNDQTALADAVARAFRDHGITAALTALIGGTMALIAAITRKAFTNEALLDRLDRELISERDRIDKQRSTGRRRDSPNPLWRQPVARSFGPWKAATTRTRLVRHEQPKPHIGRGADSARGTV